VQQERDNGSGLARRGTVHATVVRVLLCATALLAALLAAAPRSNAAAGIAYGLTDDAWLADGPGTVDERVQTLSDIGVRLVRVTIHWDAVAPTEPADPADPTDAAYDWSSAGSVLDALHAHHVQVLLQLVGTPGWANGGKSANVVPATAAPFGAFATAAARRYPWVRRWLIWNEPNQARWLRPTLPTLYVTRLLNPAYAAIHAAIPGASVGGGGTAPRGATGGLSPVAWLLGMHRAGARLDAYAHNPYPLDPRRESPLSGGCVECSTITMATLDRLEALVTRNFPHARIWLTEYGYQSNPPDRLLGVSLPLQARYLSEGAYVAYHAPRVDLLVHFLYRDEPDLARFQSGLVTIGDTPKPALAAYELPLAQTGRRGAVASLWGQLRAPAAGRSAILERRVGRSWRRVATVTRGAGGFFRWHGTLPRRTVVRVQAGALTGAPLTLR
jgi:hypothetical protein